MTRVLRPMSRASPGERKPTVSSVEFFATCDTADLIERLTRADIAFAVVNDMDGLCDHPHLRRVEVATPSGPVIYPAPPVRWEGAREAFGAVPALGQHTEALRDEFRTAKDRVG